MSRSRRSFEQLVQIMHTLRSPGGCPWDAEQSHESIAPYTMEEAFEVVEAIERRSDPELCDELGDLLLQVVFHAELAAEREAFTIEDVVEAISSKLVRRHPHVFADTEARTPEEVARNWTRIKQRERAERGTHPSVASALDGIPRSMPALLRAHRMGEKAASVGFDWPSAHQVKAKILEELAEVDQARNEQAEGAIGEELGDLLFAVANYARHLGHNAEAVLRGALERFETRFQAMERALRAEGIAASECDAAKLDEAWRSAKRDR